MSWSWSRSCSLLPCSEESISFWAFLWVWILSTHWVNWASLWCQNGSKFFRMHQGTYDFLFRFLLGLSKENFHFSFCLSLSLISNILFFSFYSLCFSIFEDSIDISSSSEILSSDGSSLSASPSVAFFIFCYIEIFSSSEILSSAGSSLSASTSVAFFISCYSIFDPYHFFLVLF